jgi:DNA segregation ATPase FtsK/SpoIIIE, S-DNA-T family
MQRLNDILEETERILSNPHEVVESTRMNFDFSLLTKPTGQNLPGGFEVGEFISSTNEIVPAFLPFADANGVAFSIEKVSDFAFFNGVLEQSTFQILSAGQFNGFKLTLIDGKNHGIYLGHLAQLDDTITEGKIYKEQTEISKILNEILLKSIKEFRFIVINNFPQGFTSESSTALIKILNNAKEEKIKVLMTKEHEPPRAMADLDSSISNKLEVISFDKNNQWFSKTLSKIENIKGLFTLNFGSSFSENDMKGAIKQMNALHETTGIPVSENFNINEGIKIPVGKQRNKTFYFRLGHGATNFHAIIGGRSGKGKTVFLDNIIARGMNIYSPDELRFVLLDMKGIEFSEYKNVPHVQAFCSSSNFENGLKIIEFLQSELRNREALFNSVEASDIVQYKKKSGKTMPRLLVIIDEFQNLFTGNYKTDGIVEDTLIKQILRIGRAYGIHLLCCTQSLGDGVRSSFLNNIPLRIAFQMTQDQSRSFLSISNTAADSLKVGEVIYNEQDGLLSENIFVNIDHLISDEVHQLLKEFEKSGKPYQSFEKLIVAK